MPFSCFCESLESFCNVGSFRKDSSKVPSGFSRLVVKSYWKGRRLFVHFHVYTVIQNYLSTLKFMVCTSGTSNGWAKFCTRRVDVLGTLDNLSNSSVVGSFGRRVPKSLWQVFSSTFSTTSCQNFQHLHGFSHSSGFVWVNRLQTRLPTRSLKLDRCSKRKNIAKSRCRAWKGFQQGSNMFQQVCSIVLAWSQQLCRVQ